MLSSRMTTSRPCSTRRLAFSITISATATWRVAAECAHRAQDRQIVRFSAAAGEDDLLGTAAQQSRYLRTRFFQPLPRPLAVLMNA